MKKHKPRKYKKRSGFLGDLQEFLMNLWLVLSKPGPNTFQEMAKNSDGKMAVAITMPTVTILIFMVYVVFLDDNPFGTGLIEFILTTLLMPFLLIVWSFCIFTIISKLLHRKKVGYESVLYILSVLLTLYVVLSLPISILFRFLPFPSTYIDVVLGIYIVALAVIAIRTIAYTDIWRSLATFVLGTLISFAGWLCLTLYFISLLGTVPTMF